MKNILDFIKEYAFGLLFFLGLFLIWLGYTNFGNTFHNDAICHLTSKSGEIISISGILSFLLKINQYKKIYTKALEEVIYSKVFLSKRKDLYEIWKNVTTSLFESKYPEIHDELTKTVFEDYLPTDKVCLFKNSEKTLKFEISDDKKYLFITDKTDTFIQTSKTEKFPLKFHYWNDSISENFDVNNYRDVLDITELKIDGKDYLNNRDKDFKISYSEGKLYLKYEGKLPKGKNAYHLQITSKSRHIYPLPGDYYRYDANFIVENIDISIIFPEDEIRVFLERSGTLNDFKIFQKEKNY